MNPKNKYQRIKLPYELNDLEPIISYQTMYWHYHFLHRNYELKLNETLAETETAKSYPTLENLMVNWDKLPPELKEEVRFFGGGLINHNFFFQNLTKPNSGPTKSQLDQKLLSLISQFLQSRNLSQNTLSLQDQTELEKLKRELVKSALKIRGSGWTWLVLDQNHKLQIINTFNQDSPWIMKLRPLIGIDVWEHAYYLDYHANRQMYVEKLVAHLLNWEYINQLYLHYLDSPSLLPL